MSAREGHDMQTYATTQAGGTSSDVSQTEIVEEAAVWVLRITGQIDLDDAEADEFHRWLRADARHAAEYQVQLSIVLLGRDLPADVQDRLRVRRTHAGHLFSFPRLAVAALALMALGFVCAAIWMHTRSGPLHRTGYMTKTAEIRSIHLGDGSLMQLNSRTRVQWFLSHQDRQVDLLQGEVYIDVARDTRRPFLVRVGRSEVRVLGTRFDVYRKDADTVVLTVVEGTVQVAGYEGENSTATWIKRISAPRKIEYRLTGMIRDEDDSIDALKWRDGVVQFREKSLGDAVEELRRYTDRRVVVDQRLVNAQVGGVYSTQDVTTDFRRMAQFLPMTVHDDGTVIALSFKGRETSHEH